MNAPRTWPKSSLSIEARRDRAAVDDDERALRARAALHDLVRDELLAGAALALDEHVWRRSCATRSSSAKSRRIASELP